MEITQVKMDPSEIRPYNHHHHQHHQEDIIASLVALETPHLYTIHRLKEVLADYHLTPWTQNVAMGWLKEQLGKDNTEELERLKHWLTLQMCPSRAKRLMKCKDMISPWQIGCPEIIPKLTSRPVWDTKAFPWIAALEGSWKDIRQELLTLQGKKVFQQYRAPAWSSTLSVEEGTAAEELDEGKAATEASAAADHSSNKSGSSTSHEGGDWNVCYLYLHNMDFSQNRALCPKTSKLLEQIPRQYQHAFFSALAPATNVTKHHGPTNKKLRCQLPLVVPPRLATRGAAAATAVGQGEQEDTEASCCLRVADQLVPLEEGKAILIDDSFEHSAFNHHPIQSRIVLVFDVWHPDLSDKEIKFFSLLLKAEMRAGKKLGALWRASNTSSDSDSTTAFADAKEEEGQEEGGVSQKGSSSSSSSSPPSCSPSTPAAAAAAAVTSNSSSTSAVTNLDHDDSSSYSNKQRRDGSTIEQQQQQQQQQERQKGVMDDLDFYHLIEKGRDQGAVDEEKDIWQFMTLS